MKETNQRSNITERISYENYSLGRRRLGCIDRRTRGLSYEKITILSLICIVLILTCRVDAFQSSRISKRHPFALYRTASSSDTSTATNTQQQQQQKRQQFDTNNKNNNNNYQRSILKPSLDRQIAYAGRKGRTDKALELFYSVPNPTVRQINAVIDACARARPVRLEKAQQIFNQYFASSESTLKPNVYSYGSLMNAISRSGKVNMALDLLKNMENNDNDGHHVKPNAVIYQSAVTAAANAGKPNIALQLLETAKQKDGVKLTVIGYNAAVSAAARVADYKLALELLNVMKTDNTIPNPDSVTYGTVMAACENSNEWTKVLEIYNDMQNNSNYNIQPDGLAITSALHACQQLGLADKAIEYLEQMKTIKNQNNNDQQHHTAGRLRIGSKEPLTGPDAVAYRLTISACARGGAWLDGIRILNEYIDLYPPGDVIAYTSAISGCEYAGEWEHAFRLLSRMKNYGIEPNEVTFATVINACATACTKLLSSSDNNNNNKEKQQQQTLPLKPQKKALRLLDIMRKDTSIVNPNIQVYNAAIRVCGEAHDVVSAFNLLDKLYEDKLQPSEITYGCLMTACERSGNMKYLNKVFQLMKENNFQPNEIIYGAAISCCRKNKQAERAYLLLRKMLHDGLQPNVATFNTVLIAQTEIKKPLSSTDIDRAITIFQLLCKQDYNIQPNRQSYNTIIRLLVTNSRPADAEILIQQMKSNSNYIPDVDLYTATVAAYEQQGQPLKALRLMESMREDGYDFYESDVLNTMFKKAVKFVNVVDRSWPRTKNLNNNDNKSENEMSKSNNNNSSEDISLLRNNDTKITSSL